MVNVGALNGEAPSVDAGRLEAITIRVMPLVQRQYRRAEHAWRAWPPRGTGSAPGSSLDAAERALLGAVPTGVLPLAHAARHHPEPRASRCRSSRHSRCCWRWRCRRARTGPLHFAYVRLPRALPRFVPVHRRERTWCRSRRSCARTWGALSRPAGRGDRASSASPARATSSWRRRGGRSAPGARGGARPAGGQSGRPAGDPAAEPRPWCGRCLL